LAGATNVPEPVIVMVEQPTVRPGITDKQSTAIAVALPPGLRVHGYDPPGPEQVTVDISQRTREAAADASGAAAALVLNARVRATNPVTGVRASAKVAVIVLNFIVVSFPMIC
jgi:hypothetical protein